MSAWLAQFHFLRPWWLALAAAWLPVLVWRMRAARGGALLGPLADAVLLPYLTVGRPRARHATWVLAFCAATLATLALAGPTWQRLPQPLYGSGAAEVVVVSLSQRMLARDVKPNRMQRVRFKVHDLLHANAGGRNGLVAYAGAAFTVAPLTTDAHALDDLVDALAPDVMPVQGDAPARGISQGAKLLAQAGVHGGALVLVTDRADTAAVAAARAAHAKGIRVSVLGVGTARGAPVTLADGSLLTDAAGKVVVARREAQGLRAVAAAGGGTYVPMRNDHADIDALTAELRHGHRIAAPATAEGNRWRDMGPWLLLPLLLLAAVSFRRGWLLALPLVLLPSLAVPAHAAGMTPAAASSVAATPRPSSAPVPASWPAGWSTWWHNADQRAQRALADGHPRQALALAHAPELRGAAAYRAGKYAVAAKAFAQGSGTDAAYNLGNALARQGHYRQAIKAYDKALQRDPDNADARANRKAVREWLRKHQPPRQSPPNQQGRSAPSHGRQRQPSAQPQAGKGPARAASRPSPAHAGSAGSQPQPAAPASAGAHRPAPGTGQHAKLAPSASRPDAGAARAQHQAARRAGRALERQLPRKGSRAKPTFDLGQTPAGASSAAPLPQAMQRALERVPDDPGGLLRRKFQLEYQERQNGNAGGGT